ncbi:hypothetical protein GCM10009613_20500 [Pseudonocardia kongjuensis]|uniref:Uncharacterized protein n=1 Tax=Pseudonocardia kongjuensis TaxID=102227 RepID=A0ABN1XNR1_9PSEU
MGVWRSDRPRPERGARFSIRITALDDGLDHRVDADTYVADLAGASGRFRVRCGARIVPVALCTPPGPVCAACVSGSGSGTASGTGTGTGTGTASGSGSGSAPSSGSASSSGSAPGSVEADPA